MSESTRVHVAQMEKAPSAGPLIVIGGHEDREGEMPILREVAQRARGGPLVVITVASKLGDELFADYHAAFRRLGVTPVQLPISVRRDALDASKCKVLEQAAGVFFTGGDQLRITSELGGTHACALIYAVRRAEV